MANSWHFDKTKKGFSGAVGADSTIFNTGEKAEALVREICQNSLDACLDKTKPVIVSFTERKVKVDDFDCLRSLKSVVDDCTEFIYGLDSPSQRDKDFLSKVENAIKSSEISLFVASDYNTKGLTGSDELGVGTSAWNTLVFNERTTNKGKGSGGSYGVGKHAAFTVSDLSTVFYNTVDCEGKSACIGVTNMTSHWYDSSHEYPTTNKGYYCANSDFAPIRNSSESDVMTLCDRSASGTDILMFGFNAQEKRLPLELNIKAAVIKNFFVAILNDELVVNINGEEISSKTIDRIVTTEIASSTYRICKLANRFYSVYTDSVNSDEYFIDVVEDDDVRILVKAEDSLKCECCFVNDIGMVSRIKTSSSFINYGAVIELKGEKIANLLSLSEDPTHNEWNKNNCDDPRLQLEIDRAIKTIDKQIIKCVDNISSISSDDLVDSGLGKYLSDSDSLASGSGKDPLNVTQLLVGVVHPKGSSTSTAVRSRGDKQSRVLDDASNDKVPLVSTNGKPIDFGDGGSDAGLLDGEFSEVPHYGGRRDTTDRNQEESNDNNSRHVQPKNPNEFISGAEHNRRPEKYVAKPPKKGNRKVNKNKNDSAVILACRSWGLVPQKGIYKVVIKLDKSLDNVFLELDSLGEGNTFEHTDLVRCMLNSKSVNIEGRKIGPFSVVGGEATELIVTFDSTEPLKLGMVVKYED